jgi:hypothetical protein
MTAGGYISGTALLTTGMDMRPVMRTIPVIPMIRGTVMVRGLVSPGLTTSMATGFPTRTALRISRTTTTRRRRQIIRPLRRITTIKISPANSTIRTDGRNNFPGIRAPTRFGPILQGQSTHSPLARRRYGLTAPPPGGLS